ncbi:hypothetical protein ABTK99_19145, partial [Acinetobacter baumannii]
MRAVLLAGAALALAGAASGDSRSPLDRALAGRVAGAPVRCIDNPTNQGPEVIDSRTIIYRDVSRLWVNHLPEACPSLSDNAILIVNVYGGQLCENDRFRTVERES